MECEVIELILDSTVCDSLISISNDKDLPFEINATSLPDNTSKVRIALETREKETLQNILNDIINSQI